jgi:hypothetical protein
MNMTLNYSDLSMALGRLSIIWFCRKLYKHRNMMKIFGPLPTSLTPNETSFGWQTLL